MNGAQSLGFGMKSLCKKIRAFAQEGSEGQVLSPSEFLHWGSRTAIDSAFSRLAANQDLLRIARGLYVAPVRSRFGMRAPAPDMVVRALSAKTQELIVPSGARIANAWGLTLQVPVRQIFFTAGRSRILLVGKSRIEIRQVPHWQMSLGPRAAGDAIRALASLGPLWIDEAVVKLRIILPSDEWQALQSVASVLPDWMAEAIEKHSAN